MMIREANITIKTDLEVLIPRWYLEENPNYIEETLTLFEQMGYKLIEKKERKRFITLVFRRGQHE